MIAMAFEKKWPYIVMDDLLPSSPCCLESLVPLSLDGETVDHLCCKKCGQIYDPKEFVQQN